MERGYHQASSHEKGCEQGRQLAHDTMRAIANAYVHCDAPPEALRGYAQAYMRRFSQALAATDEGEQQVWMRHMNEALDPGNREISHTLRGHFGDWNALLASEVLQTDMPHERAVPLLLEKTESWHHGRIAPMVQTDLLDEAGQRALYDQLTNHQQYKNMPVVSLLKMGLDDARTLRAAHETMRDMLGVLATERSDDSILSSCELLDPALQRAYLESLLRRDRPVSWEVTPVALDVPTEQLAAWARETDNHTLMLTLGMRGREDCNAAAWLREAVDGSEVAKDRLVQFVYRLCRPAASPQRLPGVATLLGDTVRCSADAEQYDVIVRLQLSGLFKERHQTDMCSEVLEAEGIDPLEMYSVMYQRAEAGSLPEVCTQLPAMMKLFDVKGYDAAKATAQAMLQYDDVKVVESLLSAVAPQTLQSSREIARRMGGLSQAEVLQMIVAQQRTEEIFTSGLELHQHTALLEWLRSGAGREAIALACDADSVSSMGFTAMVRALREYASFEAPTNELRDVYQTLRKLETELGEYGVVKEVYKLAREMQQGSLPAEAARYGVTTVGEAGMTQLFTYVRQTINELLAVELSDDACARVANDPLHRSILLAMYRVRPDDIHQRQYTADAVIDHYAAHRRELTPHDPRLEARSYQIERRGGSEDISHGDAAHHAHMLLLDARAAYQPSVQPLYETLQATCASLLRAGEQELASIHAGRHATYNALSSEVAKKYLQHNLTRRQANIAAAIAQLEADQATLSSLFTRLHTIDECKATLRQLMVADTYRSLSPDEQRELRQIEPEALTPEAMACLYRFARTCEQRQLFDDRHAQAAHRKLFAANVFYEAMQRCQQPGGAPAMQVDFLPTCGLGFELAGYVADTCLSGQRLSMANDMPDTTAVLLRRQYEKEPARLIGSMLLIRVPRVGGSDALVLRGVNPVENQINKMNPDSFLFAAEAYTREMAARLGCDPAVVVDDRVALAATNRPAVFAALHRRYEKSPHCPLPQGGSLPADIAGHYVRYIE